MNKARQRDKPRGGKKAIDWDEIHHRLQRFQSALEHGRELTPERRKEILRARARALAQELKKEETEEDFLEIVEFQLASERYGIESSYVREVYPLKELTPVPCVPPFVLGLINVRGRILSVLDIKKFFDLPEKGLTDLNKVILLHSANMEFGILADAILGVRKIALAKLQPPIPTLTGIREKYLKGVTDERIIVLDAEKLLSDKNIVVHEEIETT
ncbi:MAG: chemotaxis protein CheW [Bacteroidota bacterium]